MVDGQDIQRNWQRYKSGFVGCEKQAWNLREVLAVASGGSLCLTLLCQITSNESLVSPLLVMTLVELSFLEGVMLYEARKRAMARKTERQ